MQGIFSRESKPWSLPADIAERHSANMNGEWPLDHDAEEDPSWSPSLMSTFAGGLAHKFNNFLTVILGNASLMRDHVPANSPLLDMLHRVEGAAMDAENLTRQLLLYGQQSKPQVKRLDLSKLVEDVLTRFKHSVSENQVIVCEFAPDLPEVLADPSQIRRLVNGLLANASEAIGEETGMILLRTKPLQLNQAALAAIGWERDLPAGPYVWLQVGDTGCGMHEETSQHIFEPFFSTKFVGRGLGLSAALGIVREHKGRIWVDSTPGEGTTVHVLLPCADFPECQSEKAALCVVDSEPGTYFG